MSGATSPPDIDTLVDISVPPISEETETRFIHDESGEFLSIEFASFVCEQSGPAGGITVALSVLADIVDEFDSMADFGTRPDELAFYAETLREVCDILAVTAATEVDDFNKPLFSGIGNTTSEDGSSPVLSEKDLRSENESQDDREVAKDIENKIDSDHFVPVTVDRVSKSGNILAVSDYLSCNHIHVTHGIEGEDALAYLPGDLLKDAKVGRAQAKLLRYDNPEEAASECTPFDDIRLEEGDVVKIVRPNVSDKNSYLVYVEGYNVSQIVLTRAVTRGNDLTLRIAKVDGDTAQAEVVKLLSRKKKHTKRKKHRKSKRYRNRQSTTKTNQKKGSSRLRRGSSNPFKSSGTRNYLLSGKQ